MTLCEPVCDFCEHYAFNGNADGAYTGDGACRHPDHPRPMDPGDGCADFICGVCDPASDPSKETDS